MYPNTAPETEDMVVMREYLRELFGRFRHRGNIITSGGIGKKDASAKATRERTGRDDLLSAHLIIPL